MFSDDIFSAKMVLLNRLRIDNAYPEIYDSVIVINLLTEMNMVMMLSDLKEPGVEMSEARKIELYEIARRNANAEYAIRMVDGYESD